MSQSTSSKTFQLPDKPVTYQVVSENVIPDATEPSRPLMWINGEKHPAIAGFTVVHILVEPEVCVEVYSLREDNNLGMRDIIPWHRVRLAQDVMKPNVMRDEIQSAEHVEGEESDEEEEPKAATPILSNLQPMPPNGGVVS